MNLTILKEPTNAQATKTKSTSFKKRNTTIVSVALLLCLSGCSTMSTRDKNTAVGASIGAVAGAVLTGGSGVGTVGGAAIGGVIGHQIGTGKKK